MASETLEKLVPDRRLSLDGEIVGADLAGRITRITVDLSDGVFNECRIVFTDPDLKLISGKKLMGGVQVLVELGYVGKLKPVFEGEIVSVEPRFVRDQPPNVVVRCLEQLHRLALAPKTRSFQDFTTTQIVQQVAKEHGLSGEGPAGGSAAHLLQPNISDYQLLNKIAARTGHRIALDGKKLILAPPPSLGDLDVVPGDGVKRLKVALRSTEQVPKVIVRGWDWKQKKAIIGQATPVGEAGDGAEAAKPFARGDYFIEGVLIGDTSEAEAIAKATIARISERFAVASGEMVGSPELLPGKVLAFDKLGELLDGKYRLTATRHDFDKKGYRVRFEATRVAKKKTVAKFKAPPETKDAETTFIEALLVDQSGKAQTGVRVTVEVAGEAPQTFVTDAAGKVRLEKVPKGKTYSITYEDPDGPPPEEAGVNRPGAHRKHHKSKHPHKHPTADQAPVGPAGAGDRELSTSAAGKDSTSQDVEVHKGDEGAKGTNESKTVDASNPTAAGNDEPASTDAEKKLEAVAIEGAPGPLYCGDTVTVAGRGTKLTAGADAKGHLFLAGQAATEKAIELQSVAIGADGGVKGTGRIQDVHKLAADPTVEVQAHLYADGVKADSEKPSRIGRVADFADESFPTPPRHPATGFSDLVPGYVGTLSGRELKLHVRVKYVQGWRRWVLTDATGPHWADRAAAGWKVWDAAAKTWGAYAGTVRSNMIRELVLSKNGSGKIGPWLDPYYESKLGGYPDKTSDGSALPDYAMSDSALAESISSSKAAWDNRFEIKRKGCTGAKDCCRFTLRIDLTLSPTEARPDFTINYVGKEGGAGRANVTNWYNEEEFIEDDGSYGAKSPGRTYVHAHEVGHMLGAYDEYTGGAVAPSPLIDGNSIMGSAYLSDLSTNTIPKKYMLGDAAEFLRQLVGAKHPRLGWEFEMKDKGEE